MSRPLAWRAGRGALGPLLLAWLGLAAPAEAADMLPFGPGRALVMEACVQCHDLRAVVSQRKDRAAWRRTVNEMVWRGAPLYPGEADVIGDYLAEAFGPAAGAPPRDGGRVAAAVAAEPALPPGPGRELLLKACVSCHDLGVVGAARKSLSEWEASVDLMVRLGARLENTEIASLARYLAARTAGPKTSGGRP